MILAAVIMMINGQFFSSGFRSLLHLAPNMDTLVAMGSMTSFVWSVIVLFRMTADQLAGNTDAVMADMHNFYFESAAMIVTLITIGKMLEAMCKGRTTDALKGLLRMAPRTAVIEGPDGKELEIPIEQLGTGDVFIVDEPASRVIFSSRESCDSRSSICFSIRVYSFYGHTFVLIDLIYHRINFFQQKNVCTNIIVELFEYST
jgi:Cu2+-exporting ATPase